MSFGGWSMECGCKYKIDSIVNFISKEKKKKKEDSNENFGMP